LLLNGQHKIFASTLVIGGDPDTIKPGHTCLSLK
jgi:hypothetical protein